MVLTGLVGVWLDYRCKQMDLMADIDTMNRKRNIRALLALVLAALYDEITCYICCIKN